MIGVATGGPRIGEVQARFTQDYDEAAAELASRQIQNPLLYRDLWEWYGRWSSGDLPSWQSRRDFVNNLFGDLVRTVRDKPTQQRAVEPTGWARVDRNVTEARKHLETATTEEQFQAVGLLCRETLISPGQAVYNAQLHPPLDGVTPSATDAKRMGSCRADVICAWPGRIGHMSQHRRTASFREAAACTEATTSIVNLIAIMAGLRDPRA